MNFRGVFIGGLVSSFIVFSSGACFAVPGYGLAELWKEALASHERVGIASESVERTRRDITKAYSKVLPNVTLEEVYTRYSEKKGSGTLSLQPDYNSRFEARITQPLYGGGREWSLIRQAKKGVIAGELGVLDAKEAVLMDTAFAYYNALRAKKELDIKSAALKRANEQLRVAEAQFRVGSATKAKVFRAEAEVAAREADIVMAGAGLLDAKEVLKRMAGIDKDFDIKEKTPGFETAADETSLMQGAFLKRKDYLIKTTEEEIAEEGIKYAKGSFMPMLSVEGVYSLREQSPKTSFFLDESAYAAVTLTFPIFEGGLRVAELGEARSRLRQAGIERLALKKEIILQVKRAANNAASVRAVIDAYRKQVIFAEENYNVVFKQYKNGLASATDLIDADVTMTSAELELMRASYEYELSALELKRSAGTLLEEAEVIISKDVAVRGVPAP